MGKKANQDISNQILFGHLVNKIVLPQEEQIPSKFPGMLTPGNIDLKHRPIVKNKDGSYSTVRSMSFNVDGKEVLVPTVSKDGRIMSDREAMNNFMKTGQHLGMFSDPESADAYAKLVHLQQMDLIPIPENNQ